VIVPGSTTIAERKAGGNAEDTTATKSINSVALDWPPKEVNEGTGIPAKEPGWSGLSCTYLARMPGHLQLHLAELLSSLLSQVSILAESKRNINRRHCVRERDGGCDQGSGARKHNNSPVPL